VAVSKPAWKSKKLSCSISKSMMSEMKEYVGCKVECKDGTIKLTQPVLLQSFINEFDLPKEQDEPKTPAVTGEVLPVVQEDAPTLSKELQFMYRSGVGKLLHMMKWSRPEISNAVQELSRFMSKATKMHLKAMY